MFRFAVYACSSGWWPRSLNWREFFASTRGFRVKLAGALMGMACAWVTPAGAVILWNDPDPILVRETGGGTDILGGAVKRDEAASDTLYFKCHIDPMSDKDTEEYFAAFQLYEGDEERLAIGNALKAYAYTAFFHAADTGATNAAGYIDLHSFKPEAFADGTVNTYQFPQRGVPVTIVFKIQYIPGEDDLVTVWLDPDLGPGATEVYQPETLTTRFNANARFDEIRLRHGGGGEGWTFSDMAIATAFSDFVDASSANPGEVAASTTGALSFNFRSWQKKEGLPQSPIRAMAQTSDGYLWLGNDEGIVRFDGLRFVAYGIRESLNGGPVRALLGDSRGALWIGSGDGSLNRWQNNQSTPVRSRDGLQAGSITALAEDAVGQIWAGTEAGLVVLRKGRQSSLKGSEKFKGLAITALFKDQHDNMWLGVKGAGVFQFTDGEFIPLAGEGMEGLLQDSHCLLVDHSGQMWIGAGEDSVLSQTDGHWHRYRIPRNLAKPHVTTLVEDRDGTVWAGSAGGGLLQFKDGKFVGMAGDGGLAGNRIESLLPDREGNLWVGTDAGLNCLRRKSLFFLGQDEGLGFGAVLGLVEVAPGIVWAAKPNGSLYRWDGKIFNRLAAAGLSARDAQINAMLVTRDGRCWVATPNSLLLYKDPIAADDEVTVIEFAKPNIISLAEDRADGLWTGTRDGNLWRFREGKWLAQTYFSQTNAVAAIAPDSDGSIWVGTAGNGLFRLKDGGVEHFDKSRGLLSEAIRTLHLDAKGVLWIGTGDGGLSRLADGRVVNFTTREGLPDNTISQVLEDDSGRLWLGSGAGIACVNKFQLDELATGKIPALYPQIFGRAEGMLSEECTSGFYPAGLKTKSGLLWFSTLKGVAVADPRVQTPAALIPNAVLEEVFVDGVPQTGLHIPIPNAGRKNTKPGEGALAMEKLRIVPGQHRIEFVYTGLSLDATESIRFRYRLDGLDTDWTEAGTRRTAFYTYLPPGDYRFYVAACNRDGVWSGNAAGLELVVTRHFWQAWWFIALTGLGLLVSVGSTVRLVEKGKLQRRLKRLEQERALERERTRIAQDLHDEMGAKLCRISYLSEHVRRGDLPAEELQDQITSISDASREVLHSLDEIVWAVNPQNDTLEHLASYIGQYALDYFQMTRIECKLDIPGQLPAHPLSSQTRHHLFLATHEALTNILKHSGATHARVSMVYSSETFEISVTDDGKGFNSPAARSKPESSATASGDGLSNMYQRMADIGGRCEIQSTPGFGTNVRFVMSLKLLTKGHLINS